MDISLPKPCANEQLSSSSLTLAAESSFTLSNVYEKKLEDDVEVSSKVELDEEITFPEGGLTAWLAILGGYIICSLMPSALKHFFADFLSSLPALGMLHLKS